MTRHKIPNSSAELRKAVEGAGWAVKSTRSGWMAFPPQGDLSPVAVHNTPSDRRSLKNALCDLRKRGFEF